MLVDGSIYVETSYLITDSSPQDGQDHTVAIDLEYAFRDAGGGRICLWIDSVFIGEGVPRASEGTLR